MVQPTDSSEVSMAIQQYRHALSCLKKDVDHKNWQHIPSSEQLLFEASKLLKLHLPVEKGESLILELSQLSLMQRRITRQLNEQMKLLSEDLSYLDKGIKQLNQFSSTISGTE
ncbi:MAG: hypothetical protein R8K49_03755 [Mariprofundaceae bacterium]